jgi:hypothetical protein
MKRRTSRRLRPAISPELDQLESRELLSTGFQVATRPTVAGGGLSAVPAVSPFDIWAVVGLGNGRAGGLIEHSDGTSRGLRHRRGSGRLAGMTTLGYRFAAEVGIA